MNGETIMNLDIALTPYQGEVLIESLHTDAIRYASEIRRLNAAGKQGSPYYEMCFMALEAVCAILNKMAEPVPEYASSLLKGNRYNK